MHRKVIALFLTLFLSAQLWAVPFTLHNGTARSIPLWIPGIMNPNLSPYSDSGVDLAVGQKIYFKHKGKKYLLLEVGEELDGKKLQVQDLVRERKKELGLK